MQDLYNNLLPRRAISPAAAITNNTAQVSQIIDMQGFARCLFVILLGDLADADATFTVLVEDGDNSALTDAAAVVDAELNPTEAITGFDFADDNDARRIEYKGSKRYVRLTITPVNNTGNAFIAAVALMGKPRHAPVTAQAT